MTGRRPPLHVAVVVEAVVGPAWAASLVDRLAASHFDVALFTEGLKRRPRSMSVYGAYERIDARVFRRGPDALGSVALRGSHPRPIRMLTTCDVVLHLGWSDPAALVHTARYGVWVLSHVDDDLRRGIPPLFWEMRRRAVYRTQLDAHLPGGERRVLYTSHGWPDPTSLHRSRNEAYWKAQGAIVSRLSALRARGRSYLESRPRASDRDPADAKPMPSAAMVVRHTAEIALGVVARRARKLVLKEEWFVAVRRRTARSLLDEASSSRISGFRPLRAGSREHFADPFVFEGGGEAYLFFERYDETVDRASIAYVRLDGATAASCPIPVLAPGYHVSYPFVFRQGDDVFMIPESLATEAVALYRAADFPERWVLEQTLLHGVCAVDATLLEQDERLWLFVNVAERGASINDELHLYSSTSLAGPWMSHPENPIVSDVRSARPAGRFFRHGGHLIRPAQDCSRSYGRALVFNRVDILTADDYKETPIARIERNWYRGVVGTHTYNSSERFETIDGRRFVLRTSFGRLAARA